MTFVRTFALFVVNALAEIIGCYLPYPAAASKDLSSSRGLREGMSTSKASHPRGS